jgi:hypothetical protein
MFHCNEILRHGIVDQELISTDRGIGDSLYAWLRRSDYSKVREKVDAGFGIGLPIKGVPVKGDGKFSESDFNEWKRQVDAGMGRSFTETESILIMKSTVSASVVEAWTECIRQSSAPQVGLVANLEELETPEHVAFSVRYIPDRPSSMPPVVTSNGFQVLGATALTPLNEGDEIPFGGVGTLLSRDRYEAVSIQLNTSAGSLTKTIAGRPRPPVPPAKEVFKVEVIMSGSDITAYVTGPAEWLPMIQKVEHSWRRLIKFGGSGPMPTIWVPMPEIVSQSIDVLSRFLSTKTDRPNDGWKCIGLDSRIHFGDGEQRDFHWTRP